MPRQARTIPAPIGGSFPDAFNPRVIPPGGAARLANIRLGPGYVKSRPGTTALTASAPATVPAVDVHNVMLGDGVVETFYHTKTTSHRFANGAWSAAIAGMTWTGTEDDRFWTVLAPFGVTTKGRILINNGIDAIRVWDGSAASSLGASAVPAHYALTGDDARLFTADTLESAERFRQRVRWTTVGLTQGDHTAWTALGSGALDLRNDSYPITGLFRLAGRIWVAKTKSLNYLVPTGVETGAYGYETLTSGRDAGADGIIARGSLVQFGELVGFLSHRTLMLFTGANFTDILGRRARRHLFSRLNFSVLDRITSVVDAERNRLGWGFPLDGATQPNEIWWYDVEADAWEMDTYTHTTLSVFTNVDITTVDELAGTVDALSGTVDALSLQSATQAKVVACRPAGLVEQFDDTAVTDNGVAIAGQYVSPAFHLQAAEGRAPRPEDRMILDEVLLWLQDYGSSYTLNIDASDNNGVTWQTVGSIVLVTASPAALNSPRLVEGRVQARLDMGKQCQIRLTNATTGTHWGWSEMAVTFDVHGTKTTTVVAGGGQ